jgi:hypothetical protein
MADTPYSQAQQPKRFAWQAPDEVPYPDEKPPAAGAGPAPKADQAPTRRLSVDDLQAEIKNAVADALKNQA